MKHKYDIFNLVGLIQVAYCSKTESIQSWSSQDLKKRTAESRQTIANANSLINYI